MQKADGRKVVLFVGLLVVGVLLRVVPHPANVTPVLALTLFAGTVFPRRYAIALSLVTMLISDAFIGFYALPILAVVYVSLFVPALLAPLLGLGAKRRHVAVFAIASSLVFYLTTNFAVWLFTPLYAHTLLGLGQSYVMALPFLRNELVGTLLYSLMLFELARLFVPRPHAAFSQRAVTL